MSDVYLDASASGYQQRARRLVFVAVAAFTLLIARLAFLQLVDGDSLKEASVQNFERTVRLPADCGSIRDRKGRLLAFNRPAFELHVIPSRVTDPDALLTGLREVLELDELELVQLREKVEQPRGAWRHRPFRVARDIDRRRVALAEALRARVDGLEVRVEYQREYPEGEIGAHLVGYLGRPTARELEQDKEGRYSADSMVGRFGLERAFEAVLGGRDGLERYAVNARGARQTEGWAERAMAGKAVRRAPERGHDIVLTVDLEVQRLLMEALSGYESGSAVVLDARDGAVLGVVSKPTFDPNLWSGRLSAEDYRASEENPYKPMLDKSVHTYFPGSVYKVVTALAGLEEGVLSPEEPVESPGFYEYGNRIFHCHKRSGHGAVDLFGAMAASADVYFYKLGERMGIDTLADYGRRFGFGESSGLNINGESPGIVPTKAYHDTHTDGGFQHGLALSTAIGQGDVRTSPVQMAVAYAALANGGNVFQARVVDRIEDESGQVVSRLEPQLRRRLDADPAHVAAVGKSLERAVNDPVLATGHQAAIAGGTVAGKTGTAQVRKIIHGHLNQSVKRWRDRDHAWFAAFAPYEAPRVVVVVFLEHGGSGGKDAAPIARKIIEGYHQRIEPLFSATAENRSHPTVRRRRR
jgi:penicillin-binding protein 2